MTDTVKKKKNRGVVILKRKSKGLSSIKGVSAAREYGTNSTEKDYYSVSGNGEYVGEYKQPNLPNGKRALALFWNDLKKQWCWGSTIQELHDIVNNLKKRFPKNHYERPGQIITSQDVDLENFSDPFFNHADFEGSKYMVEGRILLNLDVDLDRLYYYSYKGNHKCHDLSGDQNSTFIMGAEYELINPKKQDQKKSRDYKAEADASKELAKMEFEVQKMVAEIMNIPGYDKKDPDPDALFIALTDYAVKNLKKESIFNDQTGRDYFLELAKYPRESIVMLYGVTLARKAGIIRNKGTHWQFNSGQSELNDRLPIDNTIKSLMAFFAKEENLQYYTSMNQQLKAKGIEIF